MKNQTIITVLYILATFSPSSTTARYLRTRRRTTIVNTKNDENIVHNIPLIPHHVQQERRRRQLQDADDNKNTMELHYGKGTHYIDLWIGTPPQRQTVIVDTGSGVTALPCSGCVDCGAEKYHIDNYFSQQQSTTFHDNISCNECLFGSCSSSSTDNNNNGKCTRTQKYIEGSEWTAQEVSDIIRTSPVDNPLQSQQKKNDAFQLRFGCQSRVSGLFQTQLADGVMGMDKNARSSFWKQAYDQHSISNQAFSLCFSDSESNEGNDAVAGVMTLGGTDLKLHKTDMVYADQVDYNQNQVSISHYYTIRIKKIYFRSHQGGTSVLTKNDNANDSIILPIESDEGTLNGNGGIILDSGSTETYFAEALEGPFKEAFNTILTESHKDWFDSFTKDEYALLPTILIQLQGSNNAGNNAPGLATNVIGDDNNNSNDIIVAMPPSHYMEYSSKNQRYTTSIKFRNGLGILGANFMMGHNIHFDNDQNRIGFAESSCTEQNRFEES